MRAKGGWWMSDVNDLCVLSESGLGFNLFQPSVHRQASLQSLVHLFFQDRFIGAAPPKELSRGSGIFISGDHRCPVSANCNHRGVESAELRNWKRRHQMSRNRTLANNSNSNRLEDPPPKKL